MKSTGVCRWLRVSFVAALVSFTISTLAAPPVVSNIRASQRPGTHYVDIYYNVSDADGNSPVTVYVHISADGGTTWNVPVFTTSGAVGPGVTLGNDRHIVWNAGTDWPGTFNSQCKVRIVADDGTAPPAPTGMAYVPGGVFQMGDAFNEGNISELPRHTVFISAFFMDKNLVGRELWTEVCTWGEANAGYGINAGSFKGVNHPIHTISWYDAAKWCNARSEREGLTPCYYTDPALTAVWRTGTTAPYVKWNANGYRLPTEAEWEKAARGGLSGKRFPWGDTISHSQANYHAQPGTYAYDVSPTTGYHPTWGTGSQPYTSPAGAFPANAYGLHDMAGNLWEWCWDWYDGNWYANSQAIQDNTRGPASGSARLLRGGVWNNDASFTRCAYRYSYSPSTADDGFGFRCVRGL